MLNSTNQEIVPGVMVRYSAAHLRSGNVPNTKFAATAKFVGVVTQAKKTGDLIAVEMKHIGRNGVTKLVNGDLLEVIS